MDKIKCMQAFTAVALHQSFTLGANQLGLSTKVASKQVQQLEAHLSLQLLNRTTRTVSLTDVGVVYYEKCLNLLDQLNEMDSLVQQQVSELAGVIRVTAPTGFGGKQLVKALKFFQFTHPKVSIDLHLSDHVISIVDEGFDLALRFGTLADSNLVAKKILEMPVLVVASPEYLSDHGTPKHPKELDSHNCLLMQLNNADSSQWRFNVSGKETSVKVSGNFKANSPRALANMAVQGLGIARAPKYHAEQYVKDKSLVVLFDHMPAMSIELFALYPNRRFLPLRTRALVEHLTEYFSESVEC